MSKAKPNQPSQPPTSPKPPSVRPENSKVVRDEKTYTTMKTTYGFLFLASQFETRNGRVEAKRSPIYVELKKGVEFFPSKFLTNFRGFGWAQGEALQHLEDLRKNLEQRATPNGEVREWNHRPRPQSQIELENELRAAYKDMDSLHTNYDAQAATIEALRAQLVAAGKEPEA